jgi:ABC-2 type transport system permease protein
MIKALLKKQMAEVFSWIFMDPKKKTRRTGKGMVGYLVLYLALIAYLGAMFFMMAKFLCEALVPAPLSLTWFYFTVMGLLALVLGVFGSVFNTYATLYLAKDNDTLLAMPIPPRAILLARLAGVYLSGLFFEMIVMLPAILAWFLYGSPTVLGAVFAILIPFVLSFFVLSLSCILGLLVAFISTRIKHKSLVTTLLALGFFALYMWGYTAIMSSLTELLAMVGDIAEKVKGPLFPFYHMGLAAEGKPLSFLIFAGIVLGIFLLVYLLLSRSFLSLATTNKGAAKKAYKRERTAQKSVGKALLGKELKRFVASPTYMLNCGLGALFLPIAGVVMLVFRADIQIVLPVFAELFGNADVVPLLLAAVACTMGSMIDITAPSVSLEGKHIWILQTLPVNAAQVLHAKLKLHLLIAVPPTAFAVICLLIATTPSLPFCFLIPLATLLFTALIALFGLFMNLKAPNLAWVNETVPVKQSLSVTVTLFGGWGFVFGLGALYIPLHGHIAPALYLGLCCVILAAACACLFHWINQKGAKIFAQL